MQFTLLLAFVALPLSLAKNISISVGQAGIVFDPEVVTAKPGDLLQFHFYPKNHSVAQSSFSSPCHPSTGGVYSGFMPETSEGETVFEVTVNNTDPIYLYCTQVDHCQKGMAMVVNPPVTGNTLTAYKQAAQNATTVSPAAIAGGVFIDSTDNSTSSSSTASSGAGSTATSTGTSTGTSTSSTTTPTATTKSGAAGKSFLQCGLLGWIGLGVVVLALM